MKLALNWIFRERFNRILIHIWIILSLLYLSGLLFAWLNGWRYRTFVYWIAFLLLFVGPSATLYFWAGRYDDKHEGKGYHVAVATLSTIAGIALFLCLSASLPYSEKICQHEYIELYQSSARMMDGGYASYAKAECLLWMVDIDLPDANKHSFKGSGIFFLP